MRKYWLLIIINLALGLIIVNCDDQQDKKSKQCKCFIETIVSYQGLIKLASGNQPGVDTLGKLNRAIIDFEPNGCYARYAEGEVSQGLRQASEELDKAQAALEELKIEMRTQSAASASIKIDANMQKQATAKLLATTEHVNKAMDMVSRYSSDVSAR